MESIQHNEFGLSPGLALFGLNNAKTERNTHAVGLRPIEGKENAFT